MVLRQGLALTAGGMVIGTVGAAMAAQTMAAMLFGISPLDLITYLGVVALLEFVSPAACGVPAWRTVHVNPACTLRVK
jgi:putative ABC transport system permease protein